MSPYRIVGTVVRIYLRDTRGILLVQSKRLLSNHEWELPGGKLEDGETLYRAAQRELKEETSLTLLQAEKVIDWKRRTPFGTHWRYVVFRALKVAGTAHAHDPNEIICVSYFPPAKLPTLDEHSRTLFRRFARIL